MQTDNLTHLMISLDDGTYWLDRTDVAGRLMGASQDLGSDLNEGAAAIASECDVAIPAALLADARLLAEGERTPRHALAVVDRCTATARLYKEGQAPVTLDIASRDQSITQPHEIHIKRDRAVAVYLGWSTREPSKHFVARSLTEAKRIATRDQMYSGTVLKLYVNGYCAAIKEGGRWENCE